MWGLGKLGTIVGKYVEHAKVFVLDVVGFAFVVLTKKRHEVEAVPSAEQNELQLIECFLLLFVQRRRSVPSSELPFVTVSSKEKAMRNTQETRKIHMKEGRKEGRKERRKEARKEARKEGRKEGRKMPLTTEKHHMLK